MEETKPEKVNGSPAKAVVNGNAKPAAKDSSADSESDSSEDETPAKPAPKAKPTTVHLKKIQVMRLVDKQVSVLKQVVIFLGNSGTC